MAPSFADPLSLPARASVTATTLVLVLVMNRALFRRVSPPSARAGGVGLVLAFLVAAAFAHIDALTDTLAVTFPIGLGLGIAAAVASLFFEPARRAFDDLTDAEVRVLLSFRAIYGALLLALGAIGHFPVSFAISAGLGDLAVTAVAFATPVRLDRDGPPWARLAVHGLGLADMIMVLVLAGTVVRPWTLSHENAATTMTLPWLAVPLMFALNAHGVRRAARSIAAPVRDGSQPAGGVRGALP
jgi:hypothetical protein